MTDDEYMTVEVTFRPNQFGGLDISYEVLDASDTLSDEFWQRLWNDETIDCKTLGLNEQDGHDCPACRNG